MSWRVGVDCTAFRAGRTDTYVEPYQVAATGVDLSFETRFKNLGKAILSIVIVLVSCRRFGILNTFSSDRDEL